MPINRDFLDELEGGGVATLAPQDYIIPPAPVIPKKKKTGGINYDFLDSLEAGEHEEVIENKAKAIFDPEGVGYDYETAKVHGLAPDETGHWPSRVPQTGQILKGQNHPTYNLTLEGEKEAGYEITKGKDGKYYSQAKSLMFAPEDPQGQMAVPEPGSIAKTFGRGAELIERGGKQLVNRLVLDTVESWRPSSLYTKGSRINAARMKNYRELGDQWEDLSLGDKVTKFPQYLWADIRALYGNESRAKQAIAQTKLQKERGAYKIQLPPPEGVVEKGVDIVAGLSAFLTKLWLLKKVGTGTGVIPKQSITGDMAVWEALGLAEQDIPGKMAAVRGALGAIGKTPTGSLGGKVAKTGAESALFAGVTAATGGSVEDIIIASLVPVAFNAWGFARQRQHITQYEQGLKSKALAAHQQRVKGGMSRPTSEAYLKADQRVIATAVAKAKQAIYHDDAFAPTKDKWEMQRQKALKMVASGKPKQVQRGKDILRFLELKPGEIPPKPIAKQIQEAKRAGEAVRGEKFKPPTAKPVAPEAPKLPTIPQIKPKTTLKGKPTPIAEKVAGMGYLLDDGTILKDEGAASHINLARKIPEGKKVVDAGFLDTKGNYLMRDEVIKKGKTYSFVEPDGTVVQAKIIADDVKPEMLTDGITIKVPSGEFNIERKQLLTPVEEQFKGRVEQWETAKSMDKRFGTDYAGPKPLLKTEAPPVALVAEGKVAKPWGKEGVDFPSDMMRLDYIKTAEVSGIVPTRKELMDAGDFVIARRQGNKTIYYEQWSKNCWDALYEKPEYKGLSRTEAIDKFVKERFTKIASANNQIIESYEYKNGRLTVELAPPPSAEKPAKEAWEMTATEFEIAMDTKWNVGKKYFDKPKQIKNMRREILQNALEENKPVPREVLEEYKSEKWAQEALSEISPKKKPQLEPKIAEKPTAGEISPKFEILNNRNQRYGDLFDSRDAAEKFLKRKISSPMARTQFFVQEVKPKEQKDDSQKKERLVRGEPQGEKLGRPVQEPKEGEGEVKPGGVLQGEGEVAEKKFYTSVPEEWREHKELTDWGKKGLRTKGNVAVAVEGQRARKSFAWRSEFEEIPTRLPKATMDAFRAKTDEIWHVSNRRGESYYLVPKQVVAEVREGLGEEAFKRSPKREPTKRQRLTYAIQSMVVQGKMSPDMIGEAVLDLAKEYGLTEAELTDNQKGYIKEYRDAKASGAISEDIQERERQEVRAGETKEERKERIAIQEEAVAGEIGERLDKALEEDFLEGIEGEEKPAVKLPKKEIQYLEKMTPTVVRDLKEGRDFDATLFSIRSGISTAEYPAYKQFFVEKGITDKEGNYLKPRPKELEELSDAELTARRNALPKYKNDMNLVQRAVADEIYLEQLRRYKGKVEEYNKKATEATGLKHGDKVHRFQVGAFGIGGEEYTGKVIYDKNGRLAIRTDRPDGTGRKTFPINKGWEKVEPTDLIGRPILKGGASGKQLTLGIYADKVPPTDVPTKIALQNAVATALNEDYKKVRATKKKYKGVKDEKQLYEKHNFPNKLFIHPENPYPEMRAAWTIATKGKGLFGGETTTKAKGAAGGASVAAAPAEMGGGYGTIAPNEQSTFAEKTQPHRVAQALPDKTKINVLDELLKIASPAHRVGSREGARVLRKNLGKLSQETVVAHNTLRKIHHAFTFMNRDDVYDFIDRLENGKEQLSPRLTQIAAKFRSMLDGRRDAVQALGKGQLENFYENYFPHIWKDPKAAEKAIRQIFGKRRFEGSKSFLKKRTIMTIKEGREAGLELVSENPVDLVLLKLFEMDRYLMAHHVIQDLKFRSLIKFVYSRSPSPEGYKKIDDRAFTVYMPPEITKKEAYDSIMVDQLMDIARSLGIDAQRFVSLGKGRGRWWGYAKIEEDKVRTRYAGPEGVLTHEIGHVLNSPHRYNVYEILRRAKEGSHKEITRGKHKGEQKFVPTEEAIKHRKVIDVEWRALADARIKGQETTKGFKKYIRKTREKEAVMLEALIHAPEEFKRVAPTLYDLFVKFLNAHSELRPILDIKPSLVLGSSEARIPVPGFTVLGHYYAPEPVAKILNNYLSPGLRNNENILIASGYNMTRMMANMLNQAQLALSGFHAINVTTDMMASTLGQGIRRLSVKGQMIQGIADIVSTPISPILRLWDGVRLRTAYGKQIDTIENENLQNMVKAVVLADGRDRMDPFYYNRQIKALQKTISDILKGSPVQKIKGIGKLPFNTFGATLEALAAPLMQWYVPTGKLGLFTMLAQHEMERAETGQINTEQLHERLISSWDSVDNRMGQLVYDNLFWNKTLKDVAMLAVRSVGWNLGSWREYGGVPVDILGTKGRLERGDVLLSQKMAYSIGAIILYGTLGAVTMYLLTGKAPEEPKDYFFPKTGRKNPDGSNERISFPTYAKDWFAYGTQPVKTVTHKIHPLWGLLTDLATNKDFFNIEVRHPGDPISQQMLDFTKHIGKAFITISIRNYMKMQKTAPKAKKKNFWVSITGVVSAPSYITRSPAQKLMYHYIIERIPDKARTKESFEKSLYRKRLKTQLRKGEPIDRREAIRILGKRSFNRMVTDAKKAPFAESFSRLTLAEALNVYAIATPEERAEARAVLKSKYHRAQIITDDMKQMYKELTK